MTEDADPGMVTTRSPPGGSDLQGYVLSEALSRESQPARPTRVRQISREGGIRSLETPIFIGSNAAAGILQHFAIGFSPGTAAAVFPDERDPVPFEKQGGVHPKE